MSLSQADNPSFEFFPPKAALPVFSQFLRDALPSNVKSSKTSATFAQPASSCFPLFICSLEESFSLQQTSWP
jgi:hypothetical protein